MSAALNLVTGGAGFIGSHLVEALIAAGERVRVLDDLSSGHEENLAAIRARIDFVRGSIVDPATVARALDGVTHVFHLAACPSVPRSFDEPEFCHAVNATGTLNVVVAAAKARCRRLVFASSCAIYGDAGDESVRETRPPAPKSPYAAQKLLGEHYLASYGSAAGGNSGLETVALRFFNVYGARQDPGSPYSGVISIFCQKLRAGETATIHGDGEQTRDFVHVSDVVQALRLARDVPAAADQRVGGVFNVATGRSRTLLELHATLARTLGRREPPRLGPPRTGDIVKSAADITRAKSLLGYSPRLDLEHGLAQTLDWMKEQAQ